MITSVNRNNKEQYVIRFGFATQDLQEYALSLLNDENLETKENSFNSLRDLLLKAFPDIHELLKITKQEFDALTDFSEYKEIIAKKINDELIISSLNEYFCYIKDLADINPKYFILPLDEKPFIIDANSRVITVPAEFKKNGVGVQGDHTAETLHFIIDRYVDNVDLGSKDIYIAIQYEAPNGSGHDMVAFRDIESEPGKVIFGWTLDKDITAKSGTLKFAIHFLQGIKDELGYLANIKYRLSTLMTSVNINKSLEFTDIKFDLNQEPSQLIKNRLVDTELQDGEEAVEPIFVVNLTTDYVDPHHEDLYYLDIDDENSDKNILKAIASSSDAGYITYKWYRNNDEFTNEFDGNSEFIEVTSLEEKLKPIDGKVYYYQGENGKYIYVSSETMKNDAMLNGENTEYIYYYRENQYNLKNIEGFGYTGIYKVKANNRVGTKNSYRYSNFIKVPGPGKPQIKNPIQDDDEYVRCYLSDNDLMLIEAEPADRPYGNELSNTDINKEKIKFDSLDYKWQRIKHVGSPEFVSQKEKNVPNDSQFFEKVDMDIDENIENKNEILIDVPGWYTVKVIAERNGKKIEEFSNIYYRVSEDPSVFKVADKYDYIYIGTIEEDEFESDEYYFLSGKEHIKATEWDSNEIYYKLGSLITDENIFIDEKEDIEISLEPIDIGSPENILSDEQEIIWYADIVNSEYDKEIEDFKDKTFISNEDILNAYNLNEFGNIWYCKVINKFNKKEKIGPMSRRFIINKNAEENN